MPFSRLGAARVRLFPHQLVSLGLVAGVVLAGCGGDDAAPPSVSAGGTAGAAGVGGLGRAGNAGNAAGGAAGKGGNAGTSAGSAGKAGSTTAGSGGATAGSAGSTGDTAGQAGSAGTSGGKAGSAGNAGSAGSAGKAGSAGTSGGKAGSAGSAGEGGSSGEAGAGGSDAAPLCEGVECLHGGTCRESDGTCECTPDWWGDNCEQVENECVLEPCKNGASCKMSAGWFSCACTPGFKGTTCEEDVDECAVNPCKHGGTCTNTTGSFSCACEAPYLGPTCEQDFDDCAVSPCQNGGTCIDAVGGFSCACAPGFEGPTCAGNVDECAAKPCKNGGTCADGNNAVTCSCPPGFTGATCKDNVDDCPGASPCLNGGTCVDGVNETTCACPVGFGGDTCELTCGPSLTAKKSGNWDDPTIWDGGVVPGPQNPVTIPFPASVSIPAGLTVRRYRCASTMIGGTVVNEGTLRSDGSVWLAGPNPVAGGIFTNRGSVEIRGSFVGEVGAGSFFTNTETGKLDVYGSFRFYMFASAGTVRVHIGADMGCTKDGFCLFNAAAGLLTIEQDAGLFLGAGPGRISNNGGTIINHGHLRDTREMLNTGVIENNGTFDLQPTGEICGIVSTSTGAIENNGKLAVRCPSESAGKIVNRGQFQLLGDITPFTTTGTFANEKTGAMEISGSFANGGTLTNKGSIVHYFGGPTMVNTASFSNGGSFDVAGFDNKGGATWTTDVGSRTNIVSVVINSGTLEHRGAIVLSKPNGLLSNGGVLNRYCGATIVDNAKVGGVAKNAPVDKCQLADPRRAAAGKGAARTEASSTPPSLREVDSRPARAG